MTPVLKGKGLLLDLFLERSNPKIEEKQVPGMYMSCIYLQII